MCEAIHAEWCITVNLGQKRFLMFPSSNSCACFLSVFLLSQRVSDGIWIATTRGGGLTAEQPVDDKLFHPTLGVSP